MTILKNCCRWIILGVIAGLTVLVCTQYDLCWLAQTDIVARFTLAATVIILLCPLLYFLTIAICRYWFYRETPLAEENELPFCTVVVPAYNEGEGVFAALESICRNGYPEDRMEVIAVNDGSIDDTLKWMTLAAEKYPHLIRIINCEKNQGKRAALHRGFHEGRGEFFITIDSDSLLDKDALKSMISPLVRNEKAAAVSGNVKVANTENGIMPPMLDAGFTFAFDFIRSGQSVFGRVFCTPGALSAYRKSALMPVLDEWLTQTFMGKPAGIGEDRALTNLLLREGHDVVMQRNAVIYTNVPECYKGICKMLLRWERSNIRENFDMFKFIFKNFDITDVKRWFMLWTLLQYTLMVMLPVLLIWFSLYNIYATNGRILLSILAMSILWSTIPAAINIQRSSRLVWCSYVYGIFHAFTLFWVIPYAFFTVGNSRWLTRARANSGGKI
ncbi:MAG: glycosyltransferase family 2 protein [Lentisphaeria bacterium]|nr:glycosyltransferase family 2 protein [Lentisphaeria bacterium]